MKTGVNAQLRMHHAGGPVSRLLRSQRNKLVEAFFAFVGNAKQDRILSICMQRSPFSDSADRLIGSAEGRQRNTIISYALPWQTAQDPGARSLRLPYADAQFDWIYCDEVLEHVGGFERQYELLSELSRIARKGLFITCGNRWHPIQFDTGLPLLHWLPKPVWRGMLKLLGKGAWASEGTLEPCGSATLYRLASLLPGTPRHDVGHKRIFGIKAHFFLMVEKSVARASKDAAGTGTAG
ncbi:methyltransferase domain-containing protein [Noviherbaspirillum humi]|uniref:methyltransferase domain-containing protein n=1 Tax=Noviherbaspirillum humi TaxID=1688639 RepID=UPI0015963935|nr:methyltransferase domain-containing protein [Noviherbaspirillum humi]